MADIASSTSTTGVISVGGSVNGDIETILDHDWYRVTLVANTTYTIRLLGTGTAANTLADPMIDGIYNSTGTFSGGFNNDGLISGSSGRDALSTFTPTAGGTYYISAASDMYTTGTYTLTLTSNSSTSVADTVAATTATSGTVTVGGSVTGTIDSASDADWYGVSLVGGNAYSITLQGVSSNNGSLVDPLISGVYNAAGAFIPYTFNDDLNTRDATINFIPTASGNYYIAAEGAGTSTGTFRLTVTQAGAEVAGSTATDATLAIGGSATVSINQAYDHDWYRVTLAAGTTYQFTLSGTGINAYPGIFGIYDAAGTYLEGYAPAVGDGSTATASTIFTPSVSGTYYVDAYSFITSNYTLNAAQIAGDIGITPATASSVAVNDSVNGTIGSVHDIDWYGVSLTAGYAYTVLMQGAGSGNGTLVDPLISGIYNASGVVIPNTYADDNAGNDAALNFRPTTSGTYYIAAEGFGAYTGSFKLSVSQVAGSEPGASIATSVSASVNTPLAGTIDDAADADWFAVTLDANTTYGIRLQGVDTVGAGGYTLGDPVIAGIYNASGVRVSNSSADDVIGRDAQLVFTPTSAGIYYIATEGYDDSSGTFRLLVSKDNVGASNGTSASIAVDSAVVGVIEDANDADWYAVSLTSGVAYYISMEGLGSRNGDLSDPLINGIRNVGGTVQTGTTVDNTNGLDAKVKFTPGSTGTYYIAAEGTGTSEGSFLLTVAQDVGASTTTAGSVAIGGSVTGTIDDATDVDWYGVSLSTLANGAAYVFKLEGLASGNGTLADPDIVSIRNAAGSIFGTVYTDTIGQDDYARFTPTTAATYYLVADGLNSTGTFRLSLELDNIGNVNAGAGTVAVGSFVTGTVNDPNDTDRYAVTLTGGRTYRIELQGVDGNSGTLDDPYLNGIRLGTNTTPLTGTTVDNSAGYGRDINISITPSGTATSTYYIDVKGAGNSMGTFKLLVTQTNPVPAGFIESPEPMALMAPAADVVELAGVSTFPAQY